MEPQRVNSRGKPECKNVLGRATRVSGWRNGDPYFQLEDNGMKSCRLEVLVINHKEGWPSAPKPA